MNDYQKTLMHLRMEDAIAEIEDELEKLLAAKARFASLTDGDPLERYLLDRAFGGAVQTIYSRVELFLAEIINSIDHVLVDGRVLIQSAAIATPRRPAIITAETRRLLDLLIPMSSLAREGNFWPAAVTLAERSVRNLRRDCEAFAKENQGVRA